MGKPISRSLAGLSGDTSIGMETNTLTQLAEDTPLRPFVVAPSKPTDIGVGNGVNMVRTMIRQSQTNSHFSCIEGYVAPKRMGPPIHLHKEADELICVMEGMAGRKALYTIFSDYQFWV